MIGIIWYNTTEAIFLLTLDVFFIYVVLYKH